MKRIFTATQMIVFFACLSLIMATTVFAQDEDEEVVIEQSEEIVVELDEAQDEMVEVNKEMKHVHKAMKEVQKEMDKVRKDLQKEMPKIKHEIHESMVAIEQFDFDFDFDFEMPEIHIPEFEHSNINFNYNVESRFGMHEKFKGEVESSTLERSFNVEPETPLIITSQFGSFKIDPGEAGVVEMKLDRTAGGKTKAIAKELLEKIKLNVEKTKKGVEIKVDLDKKDDKEYKDSFFHARGIITVPQNTPISIDNQFGDIAITDIKADIQCKNQFGATGIQDTAKQLDVDATFGPLSVSGHDGPAKLHCGFGGLKLRSTSKLPLNVSNSYGTSKIYLDNTTPNFEGSFSFGEGNIYIPRDFAGQIEAAASFGDVKAPESLQTKKEMFSQSAKGDLGDGEGRIKASSSYAPLRIMFADE